MRSILTALIAALLLLVALLLYPAAIFNRVLRWSGAPVQIESARWTGPASLEVAGVADTRGGVRMTRVRMAWNWVRLLLHQEIQRLEIDQPRIQASHLQSPDAPPPAQENDPAAAEPSATSTLLNRLNPNFKIRELVIANGTLLLDALAPGLPPLTIALGSPTPIEWRDVVIGGSASSNNATEQSLAVHDLVIYSPYDAISPVLSFAQIRLIFTWPELAVQKLRRVIVTQPTLYLGPDLFWFVDEFSKREQAAPAPTAGGKPSTLPSWRIDQVQIKAGRLAINVTGQPSVIFPFYFHSQAQNVRTEALDQLVLESEMIVDDQTLVYPTYSLSIERLHGQIEFSLPPVEHGRVRNVVPTLYADAIVWKGARVTDAWVSVTFDPKGIYGRVGGKSYGGEVGGEFTVGFESGFPWNGSIFTRNVNLAPAVQLWAGEYLSLEGTIDGDLKVRGQSRIVENGGGAFRFAGPGRLVVQGVDSMLEKIPADWAQFKQEIARAGLLAVRELDFTSGSLQLDYAAPVAGATLEIEGAQGKRRFEVRWHQEPATNVAKTVETR